jgi:hypothetical protein
MSHLDEVIEILRSLGGRVDGIELYLFGSAVVDIHSAADVDVLLVYEDWVIARNFRCYLYSLDLTPPVHLIAMTSDEEKHYAFITHTRAVELSSYRL